MKQLINTILAYCWAMVCADAANAQTIYKKQYTTSDGLAGNHVYMCHQDIKGYIWIATSSGLSRFDGKNFKNYDYENGLNDNEILFATNDADNNIWVHSFANTPGISVIRNGSVESWKDSSVASILPLNLSLSNEYYSHTSKVAYINGVNSLISIKKNRNPVYVKTPLLAGFPFFETGDGKIFSGDGKGIYRINDTAVAFWQDLRLPEDYIRLSYYNNTLYALSGNTVSIFKYYTDSFHYTKTIRFAERVNLLYAGKHGVWISFLNSRSVYLYKDIYNNSQPINLAIPGIVNFFLCDREGSMWICTTDKGIFYLPDPDMISYTESDGFPSSVIYAIEPLREDTCWVGYNVARADKLFFENGRARIIQKVDLDYNKYYNNFLKDIISDNKGQRVFFLSNSNLSMLQKNELVQLSPKDAHKSLMMINDSLLGVGSVKYKIINLNTRKENTYKTGRIYAQAIDAGNNIWLGGMNGLYKMPGYSYAFEEKYVQQVKHFENVRINSISTHGQFIWIGTHNNGIYLIRADSVIRHYTKKNTPVLPSNTISTIAIRGNEIWVGTNKGIFSASFNYDSQDFSRMLLINHNDGLISPEVNEIKMVDSTVFVATYGGLVILKNTQPFFLDYVQPDVLIKDLGNNNIIKQDSAFIRYSTDGVEIEFQSAVFKYRNEITYGYRLEPFDKDWKYTKNDVVQYTNIPPGDYYFSVIIKDNRGNTSTIEKKLFISIQPLFRQTIWFKLLILSSVVAIVFLLLYIYYRYNKMRTNDKLLQGRLMARARLEVLRAQIKPHFIYNSLNAIKDYIYNNKNASAANLLQGFARLIRNGLRLADKDFITIAEEVNFLKQYLDLEKEKCENCFDYNIDVPDDVKNVVIPSLISQPFVENAVIHGVRSINDRTAKINIAYYCQGKDIICTIEDNGVGIQQSLRQKRDEFTTAKGTSISQERITYFKLGLGIDILLDIRDRAATDENATGTIITITIMNAKK